MLGIAGKIFNRPDDVKVGVKLADGCVWAYRNSKLNFHFLQTYSRRGLGNMVVLHSNTNGVFS